MFKFIKNWIATNRKSRDEKAEEKFREKLTYTNLFLLYWQYVCDIIEPALRPIPLDLIISINLKEKLPKDFQIKSYFSINDKDFIKQFINKGGVILFIKNKNLHKQVKKLERENIRYIITEDIEEFDYATIK